MSQSPFVSQRHSEVLNFEFTLFLLGFQATPSVGKQEEGIIREIDKTDYLRFGNIKIKAQWI
ncbi:MAG: hypothetical protein GY705_19335 [Bacteroidetes bacterium]|nr:hypothetical protein [Bacteroidota bacterium]